MLSTDATATPKKCASCNGECTESARRWSERHLCCHCGHCFVITALVDALARNAEIGRVLDLENAYDGRVESESHATNVVLYKQSVETLTLNRKRLAQTGDTESAYGRADCSYCISQRTIEIILTFDLMQILRAVIARSSAVE